MIKNIEIGNIRIFDGSGWSFSLPSLSVFCGTNSSGKSTLLKTLLLLQQSDGIREASGIANGKLRFVGSQVDLGDYRSFVSQNNVNENITIKITLEDIMPPKNFKDLANAVEKNHLINESLPQNTKLPIYYTIEFVFESACNPHQAQSLETNSPDGSQSSQGFLKSARYEIKTATDILVSWNISRISDDTEKDNNIPSFEISMPKFFLDLILKPIETTGILEGIDVAKSKDVVKLKTQLRGLLPDVVFIEVRPPRSSRAKSKSNIKADRTSKTVLIPLPITILPYIQNVIRQFRESLTNINYLGPLRAPAKRYYVAQFDTRPDLDAEGDFLPYILREKSQYNVWNVAPNQRTVSKPVSLSTALDTWLHYLRTGEMLSQGKSDGEIEVSTTKNVLVELGIKTILGKKSYSMADSGFGYSQVLPIIIRGLLSEPKSTLIVEQPELHLNPALQVRLAEFFVAMTIAGRQVLIETHSEHIVNAVRVISAEDETGKLSSSFGIFFIDAETGNPHVHEMSIKPDGTVTEWPTHFFGEAASLTGRLLRAQKRFRSDSKGR